MKYKKNLVMAMFLLINFMNFTDTFLAQSRTLTVAFPVLKLKQGATMGHFVSRFVCGRKFEPN